MLGEVVADQDVKEVGVAAQEGVGEDHQLALAGADGERHGAVEPVGVAGEHRGGDEDGCGARGLGLREHLDGGVRVATDEAVEEEGLVSWHRTTVAGAADDALTAPLTMARTGR
jgi:hypothetical protein